MPYSINPATGETLSEYALYSRDRIDKILTKVIGGNHDWEKVSLPKRAQKVGTVADNLTGNKEDLARLITREMGKPIKESRAEIEKCARVCRYYAEQGPHFLADEFVSTGAHKSFTSFQPLGVILAIMPWNFPFWQVFRFAAPALVAGNGVILKHASNVTGCALAIESIFNKAGFPPNLFRTIIASADEINGLIADDRVNAVTLTGSEPAGMAVAAAAGKAVKKSVLELGGSDPYLIMEDADLELAARKCAQARLINNGQTCIAAKRFIVARSVKEAFVGRLIAEMAGYNMGDPEHESTDLGPMARLDLRDELHDQVERSLQTGAICLMGGHIPDGAGFFYPPTILDNVESGMPAADEEMFGPVAAVMEAADADDAVDIANRSRFGLGAAVFTQNLELGESLARRLQAGTCAVNDFVKSDPRLPFGGIKKSGYGRELSHFGIREFTNIKSVVIS